MKPSDLIALWAELSEESGGGAEMIRRRIAPDAKVDLFAFYLPRQKSPGLTIEVAARPRLGSLDLPECRGIKLTHQTSGSGGNSRTEVRILLEEAGLREIFAILCADLVGHMIVANDPTSALANCLRRLGAWQALFERIRKEGLSPEKQRGLFGELFLLRSLLLPAIGEIQAVVAWLGWEPTNQDFEINGATIECKTSMAKRHVKVRISNEKQLDERPHSILVLAHVRMDTSQEKGLSLPNLIALLRSDLNVQPVARQDFEFRLMRAGYLDGQAELYETPCYQVHETRFYDVRDNFPRLTDANLPQGVGDIKYSIIPSDLGDFEVDASQIQNIVRNASV